MKTDVQTKNCILTADVVKRKLRRMAFEIAENNIDAESLVIAGINGNGVVVARNLSSALQQVISVQVELVTVQINKKQVLEVSVDHQFEFNDKTIILVDDVANTGKTMLYAVRPFLAFAPKKIQTLVLVERSHKQFPILIDYVGLSISTTLQEHIVVEVEDEGITGAYLI
ncbi:MAG: phosphoribosyltransferase [Chitinophagaceae bacterium]|nr:phosphoribosyltransferase [Chitinophagaceae bacterium]